MNCHSGFIATGNCDNIGFELITIIGTHSFVFLFLRCSLSDYNLVAFSHSSLMCMYVCVWESTSNKRNNGLDWVGRGVKKNWLNFFV